VVYVQGAATAEGRNMAKCVRQKSVQSHNYTTLLNENYG